MALATEQILDIFPLFSPGWQLCACLRRQTVNFPAGSALVRTLLPLLLLLLLLLVILLGAGSTNTSGLSSYESAIQGLVRALGGD